jgi:hypothetical protein
MADVQVPITQAKAKVLIRDYLRETGRKGVTSLMRDINRHARTEVFAQRTLEKWLTDEDRMLQDENWALVLNFVGSEPFRRLVPYANEGAAERRLQIVAQGFIALYTKPTNAGVYILPSVLSEQGRQAARLLQGHWENVPNQKDRDVPRTICKMVPVEGERYARFAYIALFRSMQISATGLAIYLNSDEHPDCDYCHTFVLQLWRRRDPETASNMPGELIYLKLEKNQPEFSISEVINSYFYKREGQSTARDDILQAIDGTQELPPNAEGEALSRALRRRSAVEEAPSNAVILRKQPRPIPEEEQVIDQLLEDVLPHGYRET